MARSGSAILALEAVRVFAPDAFAAILTGGEALTRPFDVDPSDQRDATDRATVMGIVTAADRHGPAVEALIRRLFPAGGRHLGASSLGSEQKL